MDCSNNDTTFFFVFYFKHLLTQLLWYLIIWCWLKLFLALKRVLEKSVGVDGDCLPCKLVVYKTWLNKGRKASTRVAEVRHFYSILVQVENSTYMGLTKEFANVRDALDPAIIFHPTRMPMVGFNSWVLWIERYLPTVPKVGLVIGAKNTCQVLHQCTEARSSWCFSCLSWEMKSVTQSTHRLCIFWVIFFSWCQEMYNILAFSYDGRKL